MGLSVYSSVGKTILKLCTYYIGDSDFSYYRLFTRLSFVVCVYYVHETRFLTPLTLDTAQLYIFRCMVTYALILKTESYIIYKYIFCRVACTYIWELNTQDRLFVHYISLVLCIECTYKYVLLIIFNLFTCK